MNGLPEKKKLTHQKQVIMNVKDMKTNFLQFDFVMVQKTETRWPRLKIFTIFDPP